MDRIAVFPASGKLGTSIYTHLSKLVDPHRLILISRNPEKIPSDLPDAGVTARQANYNKLKSLDGVFEGASTLLLISYPSIEKEHRFHSHKAAIDAARRTGVSYIIYSSLAFGGNRSPDSVAHVMQAHLLTENYLKELNKNPGEKQFSFTAIRVGVYSESFPMYTGFPSLKNLVNPQIKDLEVHIPHDGLGPGVAWAKIDNLGEASAKLIKERLDSDGQRNDLLLLSGPQTWSIEETINVLCQITGKTIRLKQVSINKYVEQPVVKEKLGSHGPGNQVPQQWATSFEALERGECAVSSTELGRLLGREPESFQETLHSMLS